MTTRYAFVRVPDASLISLTEKLLKDFPDGVSDLSMLDSMSFSVAAADVIDKEIRQLFRSDTYLISGWNFRSDAANLSISLKKAQMWGYHRNGHETWVASSNPFYDGLQVDGPGVSPVPNGTKLIKSLRSTFDLTPPSAGSNTAALADHSLQVLGSLNAAITTLVEHTSERQKDLDATRLSISTEAGEQLASMEEALRSKYEMRFEELAEKEASIAARENALDDRANTHVRRETKAKMAEIVDKLFTANLLGRSTYTFYTPMVISILAAVVVGVIIFRELSYIDALSRSIGQIAGDRFETAGKIKETISQLNFQIMYGQIRVAVQSVGLAALIWFALRLATNRYHQIVRWERELHKFRLDTERASFLVEGDLEARKTSSHGLPDILLQSFSRGLFGSADSNAPDHQGENVGEALQALLGQAARVQVGPTGVSVDVDRKGIRKAESQMAQRQEG